jgi:signal transduction histidine kinase
MYRVIYLSKQYIFLFICLLFVSLSLGQSTDSLDQVINEILKNELKTRQKNNTRFSDDSTLVIHFISEASKFKSINSDSSLLFIKKAVDLSVRSGSPILISRAVQKLGDYYMSHEMYQDAVTCYIKCLRIEEYRKDKLRIASLNDNLGLLYYYMEVFDKSLEYHQKALAIYQAYNDIAGIAIVLNNIGSLHSSREFCEKRTEEERMADFNTALDFFQRSADQYSLISDERGIAQVNQDVAAVYNKMKKPEVALGYVQKSLEYYRKINDPEGIEGALFTLGKTYYRLKDYTRSIEAYRESEKIALEGKLTGGIQYLYEALAMPYYDIGDYKNAYNTYIKYMTIRDSVYNAEKSRQIIELETKYQSELKQQEIMRLTAEKKQKNSLIYMLGALILLLGFSVIYYIRLIKKNRIIADQNIRIREEKILQLEKEKQYLAARSVMEGEEAERSRLASDLHNGLGGLLSGIKINLSSMKENAVITHENVSSFNHAISLLDTSISELRRIAHNLMPETLNHYGLKTALEDFCSQVSPTGLPKIVLQFFGKEIRYSKELELTVYRIIQELVNNSLKHSGADRIDIQLFSEPERVSAQVADNGKGFDSTAIGNEGKGKGLQNIRDRITALNGKFDLLSRPGEGSEITVEFIIHS